MEGMVEARNQFLPDSQGKNRVAVVVNTWVKSPQSYVERLCTSLKQYRPGVGYDLFLCANGLEYVPPKEIEAAFKGIFIRENTGFNLGAWDYAWRHLGNYNYFLFVQDDCLVVKDQWLVDFVSRFNYGNCGLVSECVSSLCDRPWSVLTNPRKTLMLDLLKYRQDPTISLKEHRLKRAKRWTLYYNTLINWRIMPGETARHATTVVQFTSRRVLQEVNGYNIGTDKSEAIAAEIGFSRKIAAHGYTVLQLRFRRHTRIKHRQWASGGLWARVYHRLGHYHKGEIRSVS
jgi:hypothetical protein